MFLTVRGSHRCNTPPPMEISLTRSFYTLDAGAQSLVPCSPAGAGLAVRSPLLYPNIDKAMVLPRLLQLSTFSKYGHAMLLLADHDDDALCYLFSVCT